MQNLAQVFWRYYTVGHLARLHLAGVGRSRLQPPGPLILQHFKSFCKQLFVATVQCVKLAATVVIRLRAVFASMMKRAERNHAEVGSRIGQVMHFNGLCAAYKAPQPLNLCNVFPSPCGFFCRFIGPALGRDFAQGCFLF